jgi:hypothetical protein
MQLLHDMATLRVHVNTGRYDRERYSLHLTVINRCTHLFIPEVVHVLREPLCHVITAQLPRQCISVHYTR